MPANVIEGQDPSMFQIPGQMFNPGTPAPGGYTQGPQANAAPAIPISQFGRGMSAGINPADDLATRQNNFLLTKGLISPRHATAGFYSPTPAADNSVPRPYTGGLPDPAAPYNAPQHFGDSLGIHPDANKLRAQDADNAAYGARHPTAPVSDYGSADYGNRLRQSYQTAVDGMKRQNAQLTPPTPYEAAGAKLELSRLDSFDAAKRAAIGNDAAMANVQQSQISNHLTPIPGQAIDSKTWMTNARAQHGRDVADLDASQAARRGPYDVLNRSSLAGQMNSANQTTANNASIGRMEDRIDEPHLGIDMFGANTRTNEQQAGLDQRREDFAQGKDREAAGARGEIASQQQQNNDRQIAVNTRIASGGDPRVLKTLTDAQLKSNHDMILKEIAERNAGSRENVAGAHAAATTQAAATRASGGAQTAQIRAGATTQAAGIHAAATTQAAATNAAARGKSKKDNPFAPPTTQPTAPGSPSGPMDLTGDQDGVDKLPAGTVFLWEGKPHKKV